MSLSPSKPLNTDQYFVVCSNVIEGVKVRLDQAPCPETNTHYGLDFPVITIKDMITAQKALDHLKITELQLVIGGSMGGMLYNGVYPTLILSKPVSQLQLLLNYHHKHCLLMLLVVKQLRWILNGIMGIIIKMNTLNQV